VTGGTHEREIHQFRRSSEGKFLNFGSQA